MNWKKLHSSLVYDLNISIDNTYGLNITLKNLENNLIDKPIIQRSIYHNTNIQIP